MLLGRLREGIEIKIGVGVSVKNQAHNSQGTCIGRRIQRLRAMRLVRMTESMNRRSCVPL